MRIIYSFLFYLIIPFILLRLLWRSLKAPHYRKRWLERFACYPSVTFNNLIWFHAVSVGEAEAVFPLVKLFQQRLPEFTILITTTTPTGSSRVKAVLADQVEHVYLPYDLPDAVHRFMNHFKPQLAVIMETEIWPNLFSACGKRDVPLYIVNARLSEKSAKGYHKLAKLSRHALSYTTAIAAQTNDDAKRYVEIGARPSTVFNTGNIKFDLSIDDALVEQGKTIKQTLFKGRTVWIVASTHKGEEEIFLHCYVVLKPRFPDLLLVLVPRHPERFSEVKKLTTKAGLKVQMRTGSGDCQLDTDVYIADTMGELKMLYAAADIAFVAGSMQPVGGHNVLEAAVLGVPVLFGKHMFNFKEIAQGLLADKAAIQCQDSEQLINSMTQLLLDEQLRIQLGSKGKVFVQKNQGALEKVYQLLTGKGINIDSYNLKK